jgi:gamma-glutamyl-gamma-aminobutyrate hydrolase PuuD
VGFAPDGLVEMIEMKDHPFGLAVQWHPEWLLINPRCKNCLADCLPVADEIACPAY